MVPLSRLCLLCRLVLMDGRLRWSRRYRPSLLIDRWTKELGNEDLWVWQVILETVGIFPSQNSDPRLSTNSQRRKVVGFA